MSNIVEYVKQKGNHAKLLAVCDGDADKALKVKVGFLNAIEKNRSLTACTDASKMRCLLEATEIGLTVGISNFAYMIKYGNEAQLQISVFGFIKIFKDQYPDSNITCELIYEGDVFKSKFIDGKYEVDYQPANEFARGDGKLQGGFCYIQYNDEEGNPKTYLERVPVEDIMMARSKSKGGSVWKDWFSEMAKKVVIKRACKRLIKGNEKFDRAVEIDNEGYEMKDVTPAKQQEGVNYDKFEPMDTDKPVDPAVDDGVVIDANVVDDSKDGIFD